MNAVVKSLMPNSPASKTNINVGDILRRINGADINDYLDYEYHSYDEEVLLELLSPDKKVKLIQINRIEGTDIGIEFESFLMDRERSCKNKCIFCFIDQLPTGMRDTLYYKDDDFRLSFLQGNYITLTNLSHEDVERIISLRISPINVSLHTLDSKLRSYMLGGEMGGNSLSAFMKLVKAGITLNCQIVCCPGINHGKELSKTIMRLMKMGRHINSVSIVPVGLTKHRQGLTKLRAFDKKLALQTIKLVEHYGDVCLKLRGSRVFYCADELYMMAGLELPNNEFYEDYPQLENGVGMMRLFITEFEKALSSNTKKPLSFSEVSIATGVLAHPHLTNISNMITAKYDKILCNVYAIRNEFFGESVVVSGLITGTDLINQLKDEQLGSRLLIPQNMLRNKGTSDSSGGSTDDVFLDDVTVLDVSNELGVPIRIVKQDGADLLRAFVER
ncbi:MAG: DUF512 domain-containing protein [Oscillospiraceae bacterium]|nr:DUF512 domain-containing protein [Oscillospiraceae bacterium]